MADEISLESVLAPAEPQPVGKPAAGELSLESVLGENKKANYFEGFARRTAATVAGVGDFLWGIFPAAVSVGAELGARGYASGAGENRRAAAQAGRAAAEAVPEMFGPLNNPFQKLMKATGYGEDYTSSDVAKALTTFSGWLDEKGLDIEKHTKGIVQKEDVALLTNILTLGLLNLRKGGFFKDDPASLKAAQRGPTGTENRPGYYEPEQVQAKAAEATAEVTTPTPPAGALSRASQLAGDMADPIRPEELAPEAKAPVAEVPPAKPGEIPLEAFQIGTAGAETPKAVPAPEFKATGEWQEVPPGTALEPGLEIRMDMATGKNYARANPYKDLPGGTEPQEVGGYTGPGAEYEPTYTKPSLGERFVELLRNDRRWTPTDKLTVALGATVTGSMLLDPDKWQELGLVGGAALAVKGKGGMWHPEAVSRLAAPIYDHMVQGIGVPYGDVMRGFGKDSEVPVASWTTRAVRNYLNKYAGTEGGPLKDVEIPYGPTARSWSNLWDRAIMAKPAASYAEPFQGKPLARVAQDKPTELIYDFAHREGSAGTGPATQQRTAITSYLSHVGDYLRQKVAPEKLQQYDLVRAVKETKKWDDELSKQMDKQRQDLSKLMPVYKEYPDGFKWVEVKAKPGATLPEGYRVENLGQGGFSWVDPHGNPVEYEGIGRASGRSPIAYKTKAEAESYKDSIATRILLNQEGEMMGHCVGGYCDIVESGDGKIYSLRDKKGAAHVTVEVTPEGTARKRMDSQAPWAKGELPEITQIKGKQNRAPAPEYLPYVQDFIKRGKWGAVGDLEGTGLYNIKTAYGSRYPSDLRASTIAPEQLGLKPGYYTADEIIKAHDVAATKLGLMTRDQLVPRTIKGDPIYGIGERGAADPKLLARLAAIGLGAAAGAYLGDDAKSALIGAGVGLGLSVAKPSAAIALFKKVTAPDTRMRINHLADDYDTAVGRASLAAWQLQQRVEKLVPTPEGRKKITYALDEGNFELLSPNERAAAAMLKNSLQEVGTRARDVGVLKDMLDNYVTHLWGKDGAAAIDELVRRVGGPNMSPESRFALKRQYSTLAEGKRAGLTPLTEDASAITGIYMNSIARSMANKQLLTELKAQVEPTTGAKIVQGAREAPANYVSIDHPQMRGLRVHPDIAPSLKFVYDATEPSTILRGLEAVSIATKRSAVSFSMFHAKALLDAFVGASKLKPGYIAAGAAAGALIGQDDPITAALIGAGVGMMAPGLKHIGQAAAPKVFGENPYLKALRTSDPKMAELVDLSLQGGLKYQLKGQRAALEDVYGTHDQFYKALKGLQTFVDSVIPGAGLAVKGLEKLNRAVDTFMWERLHAGMKLQTFAEKYEVLLQSNAKAHEANPTVPLKSKQELASIAASFTNDIFGGLNWRRAAEDAKTKWGRDISMAAFSPTGRRVMQVLMFAPDWTISTTRAAVRAFGEGTGVKGLLNPQTVADLHRQYIARSILYYGAMGEGLNLAFSGHHLWENQDPTTIDMGDGRKMQWSKHTMEPVHWITKPGQQGLNKLAYLPREMLNQLMGTEYLSTSGHAPRMQSRIGHAVKSLSPISVQQSFEAGEGSGIAGFLGSPIYGKTYQQRATEREIRKLERSLGVTR